MVSSKNFTSIPISILITALLIFLSGCGNPTTNIMLKSTEDSNEMNAVQMKIVQLRSAEKFKLASRESLLRNPDETLGDDLIPNSKVEKIMIPGETFSLENVELSEETKYIGIFGDFFSPATDGWSQLIDVSEGKDEIKIVIGKNFLSVSE
ncbi:MAG: type VI secretion system lipoprotein TssJ [Ignavibacteriae bacterium]|jgi:type VI secretion system VasD/TssJ family lipoprotein|nr:type VI secretion system lipoprotein TssJ [Ignavibacteriota bacterium]NOG96787.1 type VI secretion system lipoprotein TssJ [Ignavibacteriota bacterium]